MKYKQLIKNELCKIQPHGDFKTRNEAELRIFKRCVQAVRKIFGRLCSL